jgi:hypothetical protein
MVSLNVKYDFIVESKINRQSFMEVQEHGGVGAHRILSCGAMHTDTRCTNLCVPGLPQFTHFPCAIRPIFPYIYLYLVGVLCTSVFY